MSDWGRKFKHYVYRNFGNQTFSNFLDALGSSTKVLVFIALILMFFVLILNPSGLIAFVTLLLVMAVLGLSRHI